MATASAAEVVTLGGIMNFFKDDTNCVTKGELKFKSNYVLEVRLLNMIIYSKVRASMKDICYKVELTVDGSGQIVKACCSCPRGDWLCSHMAATAIYVNKNGLSKTDLPNSWIAKPRTASKSVAIQISNYFENPKKDFTASSRNVNENDLSFLFENLGNCPMKWMLGPEPSVSFTKNDLEPKSIEDLLEIFIDDKESFVKACKLTTEQIYWVEKNTKEQRASHLWGKLRRLRLTGSNFGKVIDAYDRNLSKGTPYPPSLFKSLRGEYQLGTKDSIIWGQVHEDIAIERYVRDTKNKVEKVGLCLFECGFLGSTPDGLVIAENDERGALEVKCPYKYRDFTIADMIKNELGEKQEKKDFCLKLDGTLNQRHTYWHQIQAEILATNVNWADFVVWTSKDYKVIRVLKDENWGPTNIPKLETFYINVLLPTCYISE